MDTPFYRKPAPAMALAVGAAIVAHKANANAAHALALSPIAVGLFIALLLAGAAWVTNR